MKKYDLYWRSNPKWYCITENLEFKIKDDAPPEAQESYKHYLEQIKSN